MSTVRPGAGQIRRPGPPSAGSRPAQTDNTADNAALAALPESEEGDNIDIAAPENTHDGAFGQGDGTTAKIVAARYGKFDYNGHTEYPPELRLFVSFGFADAERKPKEVTMKIDDFRKFCASPDGNFARPRQSYVKEKNGYVPKAYKFNPGVLFINSLRNATGFPADAYSKNGVAALIGLTVHVRNQKVDGRGPNARPCLLVDYIEGSVPASPAGGSTTGGSTEKPVTRARKTTEASAPAATAPAPEVQPEVQAVAASSIDPTLEGLATEALLDVLSASASGSLERSKILTAVIQIDKWKTHGQRSALLKVLRDDSFIESQKSWKLDGVTVSL
jgi:hypothetical protein